MPKLGVWFMSKIGYARVSSKEQNLDRQLEALQSVSKVFSDKASGQSTERPQLQAMLDYLREGDIVIVTELDRFARNTKEALEIIQELFQQNVTIHILNIGLIDNTATGQLIFTIFSAFAQFERELILERTQEGKRFAKAHDPKFREGRPKKYTKEQLQLAYELKQQGLTYKMIERKTGISISTQQRAFKQMMK